MGAGNAQFVEQYLQIKRVVRSRRGGEPVEARFIQLLSEVRQIKLDHAAALVGRKRLHAEQFPTSLRDDLHHITRQRGDHQPQPAGEGMHRQPAEQAGMVVVLKLVERVEHNNAAHSVMLRFAAGLGQPERKVAEQVIVRTWLVFRIIGPALDFSDEPGHQPPVVRAVVRAANVVLEEEIVGVLASPMQQPVGHQRRLAAAGVADEDQRSAIERRVPVEPGKVVRPADVCAAAGFGKGLVIARLTGERVGDLLNGKLPSNSDPEVFEDELG